MKPLFAISIAAVYGLSIRLFFGFLDGFMGIMSVSFLVIVPMIIGALTVVLTPRAKIKTGTAAFFTPWLTSLVILMLTIVLAIEGAICWIMIYPFFSVLAGLGGVIVFSLRKKEPEDPHIDNWKDPNTLKISFMLLAFPLILGLLEGDKTLNTEEMVVTKEVIIPASPAAIWQKIIAVNEIAPKEKQTSLSNALGFPRHLRTTLDKATVGGKRTAIYENGLSFDEVISKYEENKMLVLDIKTDASKIPPTVLDEHIVIGGKHVDILEDIYKIEPLADSSSRLTLSSKFRITTPFNWYAGIWADFLMSDLLEGELYLIKKRVTQ